MVTPNQHYIQCLLNSLIKAIEKELGSESVVEDDPYKRLFQLYLILARGISSGGLYDAGIDWLKSEIHQLERDLGLQK